VTDGWFGLYGPWSQDASATQGPRTDLGGAYDATGRLRVWRFGMVCSNLALAVRVLCFNESEVPFIPSTFSQTKHCFDEDFHDIESPDLVQDHRLSLPTNYAVNNGEWLHSTILESR
jgi:hypothetical protein